ncbi:LacI family DNA-binding transcriptional regulator [Anaerolineales bacterium]
MATIRDVAHKARVSIGTVSNVLNGSSVVKDETRERVLKAIEELKYYPSAAARSLSSQTTNTIGLVRTELRPQNKHIEPDPFVTNLIEGISAAAVKTGTGLTFWTIPVGEQEMDLYHRLVKGRQVDGLILFALRKNDPRIRYLNEVGFPFVVFGHDGDDKAFSWIDVDSAYGVEISIDHLVELGHHKIGYLSPPSEQYLAQQRWAGFEQGLKKHGLEIPSTFVFEGDFSEKSGQLGTHYLLDLPDAPTAIVCANDRMAFGAIRAIQSRHLRVGKDVSVVGFDDITLAQYIQPSLTTVHQPTRHIAMELFNLLQQTIADGMTGRETNRMLKPTLSIRNSTGPLL